MHRLALALLSLTACSPKLPGDVVGTYLVTMTLEENTCGANAVYLSDGKTYSAQLRADGDQGYWRLADGKPLSGKYDDGKFTFSYSAIVASSEPDAGEPGCRLVQSEVLSGRIRGLAPDGADDPADAGSDGGPSDAADAGAPSPTTLAGAHELNITAAQGSDCRPALEPRGPFKTLPCRVKYRLKGVERAEF